MFKAAFGDPGIILPILSNEDKEKAWLNIPNRE